MLGLVLQSLCFYAGLIPQFFDNIETILEKVSSSALIAIPAIAVALLLPLAFFLIENSGAFPFDRKLIVKDIIYFEPLMFLIIAESLLLCFADNHVSLKLLAIIIDGFLVIVTTLVISQSYKWLCSSDDKTIKTNYRQTLRIQYLISITNVDELYDTWMQILTSSNSDTRGKEHQPTNLPKNQTGLVDALARALQHLEKNPEADNDAMKHTAFVNTIIRNFDSFIFDNTEQYRKLIRYTTKFAKDQLAFEESPDSDEYMLFISSNKLNLLKRILKSTLKRPAYLWRYTFFDELKEAANSMQDGRECRLFYQISLKEIFDLLDSNTQAISNLWNHMSFLKELALTDKHQIKQTNPKIEGLLHAYEMYLAESISSYIDGNKSKKGKALDLISSHIFKDIDLVFWFDTVTFFMLPAFGQDFQDAQEHRIRTWCQLKRERQFGQLSRIYAPFVRHNPNLTDKERMRSFLKEEKKFHDRGQQIAMEVLNIYYKGIMDPDAIKRIDNVVTTLITNEKAEDTKRQSHDSKWQQDNTFRHLEILHESLRKMLDFIEEKKKKE